MYRTHFPILQKQENLVYLDSASTAQKPKKVIDALTEMLEHGYANIHRGSYELSEKAEQVYESSKEYVKKYIGAQSRHEIVYTYNATYAFNLLTRSLVKSGYLKKGDTVLLSLLEHHANIVPWQILAEEYGIQIEWIGVTDDGRIDLEDLRLKIGSVKLLSVTAASNVTGAITDLNGISDILKGLHDRPFFVVDASQALPHFALNVEEIGIDFAIATGHKVMTDTGVGILYGKKSHLQKMLPAFCWWGAINMVETSGYDPAGLPYRFEPGTPHILWSASVLASFEYIESIGGYSAIESHERELVEHALSHIKKLPPTVRLIWPDNTTLRLGIFSFYFSKYHPRDIADLLAEKNICVRAGHHCTEPFHSHMGLPATLRMSLYLYNTKADIDTFFRELYAII